MFQGWRVNDRFINHLRSRLASDSYRGDAGIAARSGEKKRGDLRVKRARSLARTGPSFRADKGGERERSRDPQKFSSQNEGLIAGAISPRTLRCRAALHIHSRLYVCVRICITYTYTCARMYADRCSPRPPTCQPAR